MATATTTPVLNPRLVLLRRLVARQGGEWTPARVQRAYADAGVDAPKHTTHKADLKALGRLGDLDRRTSVGRDYWVPARHVADQIRTRGNR